MNLFTRQAQNDRRDLFTSPVRNNTALRYSRDDPCLPSREANSTNPNLDVYGQRIGTLYLDCD